MRPGIVTKHVGGSVWLVRLEGEHDMATAPDLHRELARLSQTATPVVVDLSGATFMDSTILAELVVAQRRAESSETTALAVVAPPDTAGARLITVVDPDHTFFPAFESVAAALEFFRSTAARPA
jgi:anti-anti-sigma factor